MSVLQVVTADAEASHSEFVNLVRNLLKNSDERENFFKVSVIDLP